MKLETTENTTTEMVMMALLRKNSQNGITVVASTKFCQWNSEGKSVGGNCASSCGDFNAETIIQYSGNEKRTRTASITRREAHALAGLCREPSALRPSSERDCSVVPESRARAPELT